MDQPERGYRLLIIDDDETDRRLYGWLLARQAPGKFEIHQASDGASGIAALRARTFDCVLLDFSLPDVTGLEFLSACVSNGELPSAFVLITGHGNESVAVNAMKLGVQDYLVKDHVNEGRLWRAIVRAVSQRELRLRLTESLRALTAANAGLQQEITAHELTVAELRGAKEAAEQADRANSRLIATVTRELRGSLSGILGYAQLLGLEGELSDRQNMRVDAMIQAAKQLIGTVEQVLDFTDIGSGRTALRLVPLSVRDLTEDCIASIGPLAAARGLSLRLVWSHDAPSHIVSDSGRLRQVLLNLLGNAVKFTAAGWVELRVLPNQSSGRSRIEVADTGPGVDESAHGELFQGRDGSGLGLAISARFVALMGGTIGYRANPAGGSIFWVELPCHEPASPPRSATPPLVSPPLVSPPLVSRVLLVEDIAMNRDVISAFLRHAGHEVRLAETGRDGVRLAGEQNFDLILMDIRMPEMDGLEATRQIRALPDPNGHVPILALTACCGSEQILECQAAGMDGHVAKPVEHGTLMRAVGGAIARCPQWGETASRQDWDEAGERAVAWLEHPDRTPGFPPRETNAEGSRAR